MFEASKFIPGERNISQSPTSQERSETHLVSVANAGANGDTKNPTRSETHLPDEKRYDFDTFSKANLLAVTELYKLTRPCFFPSSHARDAAQDLIRGIFIAAADEYVYQKSVARRNFLKTFRHTTNAVALISLFTSNGVGLLATTAVRVAGEVLYPTPRQLEKFYQKEIDLMMSGETRFGSKHIYCNAQRDLDETLERIVSTFEIPQATLN